MTSPQPDQLHPAIEQINEIEACYPAYRGFIALENLARAYHDLTGIVVEPPDVPWTREVIDRCYSGIAQMPGEYQGLRIVADTLHEKIQKLMEEHERLGLALKL